MGVARQALTKAALLLLLLPAGAYAGMVPTPAPAEEDLRQGLYGEALRIAKTLGIDGPHAGLTFAQWWMIASLALTGLGILVLLIAIVGYGITGGSKKGRLEDLP